MKSVGEAMAIGRSFQESLQKALRSLETGLSGLDDIAIPDVEKAQSASDRKAAMLRALGEASPDRLRVIAQAMREGLTLESAWAFPTRALRRLPTRQKEP